MEGQQEGGLALVSGTYTVTIDQRVYKIVPISDRQIEVDGVSRDYDFADMSDGSFSLILDGRTFIIEKAQSPRTGGAESTGDGVLGHTIQLSIKGNQFIVRVDDEHSLLVRSLYTKPHSSSGIQTVHAPMPGLISRIEVHVGDEVTPGTGLLVLEAMKMENEIRSLTHGRIRSIHVEKGKPVEKGEPLVTISEL